MSLTIMNFNQIRDLVSNLGCTYEGNKYALSHDCLKTLEAIEKELFKEDVLNRNVRISLHIFRTVKDDLIPILIHGKDLKILATVIRILMNLSLPVEYLLPLEDAALNPKFLNTRKQLFLSSLSIKRAFLESTATLSVVNMLRETMFKSEKNGTSLNEEECIHLKNCLFLLRNLLYLPENFGNMDKNCIPKYSDWHSVQNKLIWNLFVQGIDGALILMLNSANKDRWTVPLALIIALLFRNQNIAKIQRSLELISSTSDSSGGEGEESDTSKHSSISLSSEPSKASDSGYPQTSESPELNYQDSSKTVHYNTFNIQKKLQKVQISDDSECENDSKHAIVAEKCNEGNMNMFKTPSDIYPYVDDDSESSSSSESPYHKKMKANASGDNSSEGSNRFTKRDSAIGEEMDYNSPDSKSSDDDNFNEKRVVENLKAVQKLKSIQIQSKISESDSSNDDFHTLKKHRNHPPVGRRGKNHRKDGPIDSAYSSSGSKSRIRYSLWEKRSSISTLTIDNTYSPSDDDIGFLLKEFTLSFLQNGFSDLMVDLKTLLLEKPSIGIDKSLFFWMLSYFLSLASVVKLNQHHINIILSTEFVTFLVFETVFACENLEVSRNLNENVKKYITVHLNLLVSALKEIFLAVDVYYRNSCSLKGALDEFYGKLSNSLDLRQMPLLLFHSCPIYNSRRYLEDIVVLNHHILIGFERGLKFGCEFPKVNMVAHLKQFANKSIIDCYRRILENFKSNSKFLNECVFTMWHHLAGDIHSSYLLLEPSVLKVLSEILKDDIELDQYQEDLVMYVLNKFSRQVQKKYFKEKKNESGSSSRISDETSSNSSLSSHCLLVEEDDDLFWWYLQFEQDKDPISRISEHVSTAKRDILNKLQSKGFITIEKLKDLENKMTLSEISGPSNDAYTHIANVEDDVTHLLRTLVQVGERQHLIWLQDTLLEICYVKLGLNLYTSEPVAYYSNKLMLPVPLVPYTEEQREILQDKVFLSLLQTLGLHLGTDKNQMNPRIPFDWNIDMIFTIAARLGPIRKEKLKFSYEELMECVPNHDPMTIRHIKCLDIPPLSSCGTLSSWLTAVHQNKESHKDISANKTDI